MEEAKGGGGEAEGGGEEVEKGREQVERGREVVEGGEEKMEGGEEAEGGRGRDGVEGGEEVEGKANPLPVEVPGDVEKSDLTEGSPQAPETMVLEVQPGTGKDIGQSDADDVGPVPDNARGDEHSAGQRQEEQQEDGAVPLAAECAPVLPQPQLSQERKQEESVEMAPPQWPQPGEKTNLQTEQEQEKVQYRSQVR